MKQLLLCVFFLCVVLTFPSRIFADSEFRLSMDISYRIADNGVTRTEQKIGITNLTEYTYTPSYTITVGMTDVSNVRVVGLEGEIPHVVTTLPDKTKKIEVNFVNKYVGLNKINTFTISFDTKEVAQKRGNTWEVSIPGFSNSQEFSSFTTRIYAPKSFGPISVIKPKHHSTTENPLIFNKNELGPGGVYVLYGTSQIYTYRLTYHISNPNLFPIRTEIALPPETNYQDVTVDTLSPEPLTVYRDQDGNWLAEYRLSASQKMDVIATGAVSVRSFPDNSTYTLGSKDIYTYLKGQEFWERDDATVKKASENLKTPKDVYNYVVKKLSYDYEKASGENNRLGAKKTLLSPQSAVCLEFTDLFVTLSRSIGIPARAVEGYAYTSDEKLRPLSLVKDVLHAWPEYYDSEKKSWVMVDPTWGNTTSGLDYFSSFDFDHIVFAVKGVSSTYPIPAGGYKFDKDSRDVSISFAKDTGFVKKSKSAMVGVFPIEALSALPISGKITVKNIGNTPIENKTVFLQSDLKLKKNRFDILYLPPFGEQTFTVEFENTPFLTNKSFTVTMLFDGISDTKKIDVRILPMYGILILGGGICLAAIIISIIAFKPRRVPLQEQKV